ncbi:MAG: DsrE family protein, partial [Propionibacteriaceae bacterium]
IAGPERNVLTVNGVVLHLTETSEDKQRAVLRNALNLVPEVAPDTPIELVVHGPAISLALPGQGTADALAEALSAGIILVVCRNSMRSQNLDQRDLLPGTVVVNSGVGHLVARQGEGWAYLRP